MKNFGQFKFRECNHNTLIYLYDGLPLYVMKIPNKKSRTFGCILVCSFTLYYNVCKQLSPIVFLSLLQLLLPGVLAKRMAVFKDSQGFKEKNVHMKKRNIYSILA